MIATYHTETLLHSLSATLSPTTSHGLCTCVCIIEIFCYNNPQSLDIPKVQHTDARVGSWLSARATALRRWLSQVTAHYRAAKPCANRHRPLHPVHLWQPAIARRSAAADATRGTDSSRAICRRHGRDRHRYGNDHRCRRGVLRR